MKQNRWSFWHLQTHKIVNPKSQFWSQSGLYMLIYILELLTAWGLATIMEPKLDVRQPVQKLPISGSVFWKRCSFQQNVWFLVSFNGWEAWTCLLYVFQSSTYTNPPTCFACEARAWMPCCIPRSNLRWEKYGLPTSTRFSDPYQQNTFTMDVEPIIWMLLSCWWYKVPLWKPTSEISEADPLCNPQPGQARLKSLRARLWQLGPASTFDEPTELHQSMGKWGVLFCTKRQFHGESDSSMHFWEIT